MSCGQIIKAHNGEVYFRGINLSSLHDLDTQIDDQMDELKNLRTKIKMYAIAQPNIIAKDSSDAVTDISHKIDNLMEEYDGAIHKMHMLIFAKSLIYDYMHKDFVNAETAFKTAVVDMYADLRKELGK